MKNFIFFFSFLFSLTVFGQAVKPYEIYNSKGKKVTYDKMIKGLEKADVVLFGEHHNNSIAHWLQLKVTQSLGKKRDLILGAEMFEADGQIPLNKYLSDEINGKQLDSLVSLWSNYKTDYKPLVDYAKANHLKFVATNVPRRFARIVHKEGVDGLLVLTETEKSWIAPLPFPYDETLPGYVKMLEMFKDSDHVNLNFPKAQAVKDATMGYFISENFVPGKMFIHYNGAYHSDNYEGINWYLNQYNKDLKVMTISVVSSENVDKISAEERALADYIIVIDADMTKTF